MRAKRSDSAPKWTKQEIGNSVGQVTASKLTLVLLLRLFNCGWVFRQDRVGSLRNAGGLDFSAIYVGAGIFAAAMAALAFYLMATRAAGQRRVPCL